MNSSAKRISIATLIATSFLLAFSVAVAPAAYATVPTCNGTATIGSDTYSLSLSPCSNSGVALNTDVVATGTTTNGAVTNVVFDFYNPSSTLAYSPSVSGSSPFTSPSESLNAPGTWHVVATFYEGTTVVGNAVFDINVQILVLNELPLGAMAAAGMALVGLVVVRRLSRTFSLAAPTS